MGSDVIFKNKPQKGGVWDVIIVGSGPSGLTAAIYTTRGAASTLILGGSSWGGQLMLTTEVDNFPTQPGIQGPELMAKMKDHATSFGAEFIAKDVNGIELSSTNEILISTNDETYKTKSLIVATGAQTKWLGVVGEDKFLGRGVSSCAPCDAPFFKNKKVVVVGGGDSAMEEALVLAKYATRVIVVHRRAEFRASKAMQHRVFANDKISIVWDTEVLEVLGEVVVNSLKLKTNADSKKLPETIALAKKLKATEIDKNNEWLLPTDGVFVAIGHTPSAKIFESVLQLDPKGYIVKKERLGYQTSTSVKGIFVAGDVHDYHYRQAITAAGFGCMAAMDTLRYLDELEEK